MGSGDAGGVERRAEAEAELPGVAGCGEYFGEIDVCVGLGYWSLDGLGEREFFIASV